MKNLRLLALSLALAGSLAPAFAQSPALPQTPAPAAPAAQPASIKLPDTGMKKTMAATKTKHSMKKSAKAGKPAIKS